MGELASLLPYAAEAAGRPELGLWPNSRCGCWRTSRTSARAGGAGARGPWAVPATSHAPSTRASPCAPPNPIHQWRLTLLGVFGAFKHCSAPNAVNTPEKPRTRGTGGDSRRVSARLTLWACKWDNFDFCTITAGTTHTRREEPLHTTRACPGPVHLSPHPPGKPANDAPRGARSRTAAGGARRRLVEGAGAGAGRERSAGVLVQLLGPRGSKGRMFSVPAARHPWHPWPLALGRLPLFMASPARVSAPFCGTSVEVPPER